MFTKEQAGRNPNTADDMLRVRRTEVNKSYVLNKDWWREFVKKKKP
jgi:hypothetical protein